TDLLHKYLGLQLAEHARKEEIRTNFRYGRPLSQDERDYVTADTRYLVPLHEKMKGDLSANNLNVVMSLEHKLLPVVIRMEHYGVRMDVPRLHYYMSRWAQMQRILVKKLDIEVGRLYRTMKGGIVPMFVTVNYSSPEQVLNLFRTFRQAVPKKKENKEWKESVDYDTLQAYVNERPSKMKRFIELLLKYRDFTKLLSTYGETFVQQVDTNGYLHGAFNQLGADTGRFSSSGPNLQNIPSSGFGGRIRKCFLADPGHDMITCDMEAAEVRLAADFSQDQLLLDSITRGVDMHSKLASVSYSIIFG